MILKSTRRALIGVMLPTLLALCGSNSHADRQATSFSLAFAGGLIAPEKVIRFLDSTDSRIHRQYLARLPGVAQMHSSFALRTVFKTTALPV